MRKIAHIVNPVTVNCSSDLNVAQPITFETMRIAREFASRFVCVTHFYTKYADEPAPVLEGFRKTPDLNRSISDIATFRRKRKLPMIKDILDRLYDATDAEYLVYTNVDIALMPCFYVTVNQLLDQGFDALVINRRTISKVYTRLEDIPLMCAQIGESHPGCDCFVFKRCVYPHYQLGTAFIGSGRIGLILAVNLYYHATKFKQFRALHLTFHIGDDKIWQSADLNDERVYNDNELKKIMAYYDFAHRLPSDPVLVERLLKVYESGPISQSRKAYHKLERIVKKTKWGAALLGGPKK